MNSHKDPRFQGAYYSPSSADIKSNTAYYLNQTNTLWQNRAAYSNTKDAMQDVAVTKDKLIPPVATNVPGKK